MDGHPHDSGECAGCGWERHALAFRWFPELGTPLRTSPAAEAVRPQRRVGSGGMIGEPEPTAGRGTPVRSEALIMATARRRAGG